jgi:hypothetical protein
MCNDTIVCVGEGCITKRNKEKLQKLLGMRFFWLLSGWIFFGTVLNCSKVVMIKFIMLLLQSICQMERREKSPSFPFGITLPTVVAVGSACCFHLISHHSLS